MALKPGLSLRPAQRLALTPGLRRSLELLRMPAADLADEIAREAADNPFLDVDWPARGGGDGGAFALETLAARPSLVEDVRRQLGLMALPDRVAALAAYIAGDLRDDGYLDAEAADYVRDLGARPDEVAAALAALRACDPAGIGACTLSECLHLQLLDRGLADAEARAVVARLDLFASGEVAALRRALGVSEAEVRRLARIVATLRARPVDPGADSDPRVLRPDLVVSRDGRGALAVSVAARAVPQVRLNDALLARARGTDFAEACRARGLALIRSLAQRGATLERVGLALVEAQHRFFALGPDHLVPLSRDALAARLGLHPTTVGRTVAGKALDHGGRLYPLSMFFSPALGGGAVSGVAARAALARIVAAEDPEAPLSDAAICDRLRAEGVDISRRTVAKYRGCMRIPSSHERHRRASLRGMQQRFPTNGNPKGT